MEGGYWYQLQSSIDWQWTRNTALPKEFKSRTHEHGALSNGPSFQSEFEYAEGQSEVSN